MKKTLAIILSLLLITVIFAGCGETSETNDSGLSSQNVNSNDESSTNAENSGSGEGTRRLVIYTWEGMFSDDILSDFTEETGIEVAYSNFDYNETMLTKLQASGGADYDIVVADDYIIKTAIEEGLTEKLDKTKLSNLENINDMYLGKFYDTKDEYTIPYGAGVQTIVYNPDLVDVEIDGYEDLWDESLKDNVGVLGNYRVVNGMGLKLMGESYNTEDATKIEEAGTKLNSLAPNIRIISDTTLADDMVSGEIGAAVMYTSQVTLSKLENPNLKVVYPKEGLGFGIMAQFIPKNAPNKAEAYEFIDYILRPEVAAKCFEYLGYYCTTKAAEEHIAEEYREFLTIPEEFTSDDMEMIEAVSGDTLAVHEKVWTEFKTACGQ